MESRIKWTRYVARYFEQMDFSWAYWEYNSGFGIVDGNTGQPNTGLINALLHDAMPVAAPVNLQLLKVIFLPEEMDGIYTTITLQHHQQSIQIRAK